MVYDQRRRLCFALILYLFPTVFTATDPNDLKILNDFREGLENPELLKWPKNGNDPCGPPPWPHVFCSGSRISQIQVQGLGLKGPLPQNLNQLSYLSNLGLQRNSFSGKLPTFSGLSELEFAYLDNNEFDSIPSDFFNGLVNVRVIALDYNNFNSTSGWSLPNDLEKSVQLTNLSLINCNLAGALPDFIGNLPSLTALKLAYNRLSGNIPESFRQSLMQILWLNDQDSGGGGMTGGINVIPSMTSLTQVWLHGNQFSGTIPDNIGDLVSLKELNLNGNQLVGLIPESLANMELDNLVLNNNKLMGPIPKFKSGNVTYDFNSFCQSDPGLQCGPVVDSLLDFLGNLSYPLSLASEWSGNDPCGGPWLGLSCNQGSVSVINLPNRGLNGTLTSSIARLEDLMDIRLGGNNIHGTIPKGLSGLQSLRLLDLSGNNFEPPLPKFGDNVKLVISGNPFLLSNRSHPSPTLPINRPPLISPVESLPPTSLESPPNNTHSGIAKPPSITFTPPSPLIDTKSNPSTTMPLKSAPKGSNEVKRTVMVIGFVGLGVVIILLSVLMCMVCSRKRRSTLEAPSSVVIHPRDPSDPENMIKIAVSDNSTKSLSGPTGTSTTTSTSNKSSGTEYSRVIEAGNLVISVQVLQKVTKSFAPENELGRGGFGTVYKGELDDGTEIAVKRMESGICSKALEEFQAEIGVLSKVRHRHLVSLLGYSIEGNERLLVYEYMPQGALSRHLFHWESLKLEPLSWTKRVMIALDVARGMEYLHGLAHHIFIHRDLKSSNILLDYDFRAKVSDFGLVKLAPDGAKSFATKLAGTFGYLAPEYAVMGKITTKVDVFSYGVVLMELLTGMMALDENRPEESRYLAEWFWRIKSSKEKLISAIDPSLHAYDDEETFETISIIAELAGHCTARDPHYRPDMGHVVGVLAPLVEKWKPERDESDSFSGIDYNLPLPQMLKVWQEDEKSGQEGGRSCNTSLEDSKGSIPARPVGFADSFTSVDGR